MITGEMDGFGLLGLPRNFEADPDISFLRTFVFAESIPVVVAVKSRLERDERFKKIDGKVLHRGGGAGGLVQIGHLLWWWAWRANEKGIVQADVELDNFLESVASRVWRTTWLYGPIVSERTRIAEGVDLVPPDQMPKSPERDKCIRTIQTHRYSMEAIPTCAMVTESIESKFIDSEDTYLTDDIQEKHQLLTLLLNVFPNMNAFSGVQTSYLPDNQPPGPFAGGGGSWTIHDALVHRSSRYTPLQDTTLDDLLAGFQSKKTEDRTRLRRVLERLSYAKNRSRSPHNQALDLGIALEMMLLHGTPDKQQLSLTLRLRCAWLLGKSPNERNEISKTIKKAYSIRSNVAHAGYSNELEKAGHDPYRNKLSEHMRLAERVARILILNPEPDWNTLIVGG